MHSMQVTILISIFIKSHDGLLSVANLTLNANHLDFMCFL